MGGRIKSVFFVILIAGVVLYIFSSGILSGGFNALNTLIPHPTSSTFGFGSSTSLFGPPGLFGSAPAPYLPPPTGSAPAGSPPPATNPSLTPSQIPAGYTAAQISPYFHEVRFSQVSAANFYYYGTITLSTNLNGTSTIDVTGWQVKSLRGGEYVPQAINYYDPSGLAAPSDIILKSGDTAYLYSTSAPFNLRINECVGYIAHVANFVPALPMSCPYIDRSQIQDFTGACQNYIFSLAACQAPNMASFQIPQNDYACQNYLETHFTYRSCVADHGSDPNFLGNQVWVWMGNSVVDQYHDTVTLLDRNGLLVDIYSY
jgi:hypothetical protein